MAKPHDDLGVSLGAVPARTKKSAKPANRARKVCVGVAVAMLAGHVWAQPAPLTSAEQEQRRAQERETQIREQQERGRDVRLPAPASIATERLPAGESPCFRITHIQLQNPAAKDLARFSWLTQALAGSTGDDEPAGKCLGARAMDVLLKRANDAVIAKGFVTSRVLIPPQDLSAGALVLAVLPGRIHAIRFAEPVDPRATAWNAVPAKPGDILNVRDIEQALENFQRVPTAQADFKIAPASGDNAEPDQNDVVINYKQGFPFRLSLSADDSGTKGTGKYQGGVTVSYDNWWTLNDLFYATFNHDMGGGEAGERGTRAGVLHYSLPWGYWTLGVTASKSRYFQTVAGLNGDIVYRGTSDNAEVKLSRLVYRDASRKTSISFKGWQRKSNNFIDDTEIVNQRRVVGGWESGVGHKEFIGNATLEGNLAYKRGTGAFGSQPAPEEAFGEGTSRFALVTADANLSWPFKIADQRLRYTGSWRWQQNRTPLTPQDRFAIGGRYTVRGFDGESSLSAERGWLIRNEVSAALGDSGQEIYLGLDHGEVSGPSSEFLVGKRLTGMVIGLRGSVKSLQYELFAGAPVRKPEFYRTASTTVGFNLNYSF